MAMVHRRHLSRSVRDVLLNVPRSFVSPWIATSQFPGLPLQQALDKLQVSDWVSTFPHGGGSSIWFYTRFCETSGWRTDCASVFFSHLCFYKRTCRTKPVKEQFQS